MWETIARTIQQEFSDIPDAERLTRITIRLVFAAGLAGILGYEREHRGKAAGMRTHMLVGLGSALFILVPQQAGASPADLTRVIQGLVAGIGFLGAGSILKNQAEEDVKGLTTASSIWLTAAIGVTVGLGHEATAVLATVFALVILAVLGHIGASAAARKD